MNYIATLFITLLLSVPYSQASEYNNSYIKNETLHLTSNEVTDVPTFVEQYSQFGEDIILIGIFQELGISTSTLSYLDLGTSDPILGNNTYIFYKKGARGVLVEPIQAHCDTISKVRPQDNLICGAVTAKESSKEKFYINHHDALSSLVETHAASMQGMAKTSQNIKTIEVNTYNINDILKKYFPKGLDLLSTDIEGYDFNILSAIDYDLYKPKVIITESPNAREFLKSKQYIAIWTNSINTIFVDKKLFDI